MECVRQILSVIGLATGIISLIMFGHELFKGDPTKTKKKVELAQKVGVSIIETIVSLFWKAYNYVKNNILKIGKVLVLDVVGTGYGVYGIVQTILELLDLECK